MDAQMTHLYPACLLIVSTGPVASATLRACTSQTEVISSFHRYSDSKLLCSHRARSSLFGNCVLQTHRDHYRCM